VVRDTPFSDDVVVYEVSYKRIVNRQTYIRTDRLCHSPDMFSAEFG